MITPNAQDLRLVKLARHLLPLHPDDRHRVLLNVIGLGKDNCGDNSVTAVPTNEPPLACDNDEVHEASPTDQRAPLLGLEDRIRVKEHLLRIVDAPDEGSIFKRLTSLLRVFQGATTSGPSRNTLFTLEEAPADRQFGRVTRGSNVNDLGALVAQKWKFGAIYADPPWDYDNTACRGAAENHYPTMTVDEICSEPIRQLAADRSHLHLWTTNAFLPAAFKVIDAWGFKYKSCLLWIKDSIGMGNYWRVSHEFLLLRVRGKLTFRDRMLPSWVQHPRTTHSRKPPCIRLLIERASPGPYLELYGREEILVPDWTVYGNRIERRLF